jgi:hypothetical protein
VTLVRRKARVARVAGGALALGVWAATGAAQRATRRDIRDAMVATGNFVTYEAGDTSARSDSARRIASLAATDLEGGDTARGRRLLREAVARGVSDPQFYTDAAQYLAMVQAPAELVQVRAAAMRRFPDRVWPWRAPTR